MSAVERVGPMTGALATEILEDHHLGYHDLDDTTIEALDRAPVAHPELHCPFPRCDEAYWYVNLEDR